MTIYRLNNEVVKEAKETRDRTIEHYKKVTGVELSEKELSALNFLIFAKEIAVAENDHSLVDRLQEHILELKLRIENRE